MKISISGASGFIGSELIRRTMDKGWTFNTIDRNALKLPDEVFRETMIEGSNVVINLSGATILKRWTTEYKQEIYNSRVKTTARIARAINEAVNPPGLFISASAVGIYSGVGTHTEESTDLAQDFMGKLCADWEREALSANGKTRVVILRNGIVLGSTGGALKTMHGFFSVGLGAIVGSGMQPLSWIHIADLMRIIQFIVENVSVFGIINAVAPNPTTNLHFSKTFGKVLNQPVLLKTPVFALKMLYGEGSRSLSEGQNVIPEKLLKFGFEFRFETIEKALMDLYGR